MGIGIGAGLGILGGIGRGYVAGRAGAAELDAAEQRRQAAEIALQNAKEEQEGRAEAKRVMGELPGMVETETKKRGIARTTAKEAKDAAAAAAQSKIDFEDASRALAGPEVSPSTAGITNLTGGTPTLEAIKNTPVQTGKKGAIVVPAEVPPVAAAPVVNAAAPGATAAPAGPLGIRAARTPTASSIDAPEDPRAAYNVAWSQLAPRVAAVYQKYGKHTEADAILKSADNAEMASYTKAFNNTMRLIATGDDMAAASSIENLYNLGYPDGRTIDVKPLGNGAFEVTQMDDKGKVIQTAQVDKDKLMQYAETFLSPAERAKLGLEAKNLASREKIAGDKDAAALKRAELVAETRRREDVARENRLLLTIQGKKDVAAAKTGKLSAKDMDKRLKDGVAQANKLTGVGKKGADPDIASSVAAETETLLKEDEDLKPADAADQAYKRVTGAVNEQKSRVNEHLGRVKKDGIEFESTTLEREGDPTLVAWMKTNKKDLSIAAYKKLYPEYAKTGKLPGSGEIKPAATTPAATPAKPSRDDAVKQAKAALATPNLAPEKAAAIRARMKEWYPDVKL
jgi:hypothetical protein